MPTTRKSEIRRIREHTAYATPENPHVTLYYDDVEWPDGRRGRYNRIIEGTGHSGVVILPILPSGIGMVLVDRYPVNRQLWELPRGFGDVSDPVKDAKRELLEETGWSAASITDLGSIYLNSGLLAGDVRVFAARIDGTQASEQTDHEARARRVVPLPELKNMVTEGDIPDAASQSAILLAMLSGLLQ
ncbi:MAG: NUDIX hydrolase [Nocardioides sp.]